MHFRTIIGIVLGLATLTAGADWPQFRGPGRDGTTPEQGLMKRWPEGGPKVLWQVEVGRGYGGAAIRDGEVFILDRQGDRDVLRCFSLADGDEKWTFGYEAPGRVSHPGSRSTPTVTKTHVFTVGVFGHLHCVDRKTRKSVWSKHLLKDFGGKSPRWAVSQSPLVVGEMVIVAPQTPKVGLVALNVANGEEIWRSEPSGEMRYTSPVLTTIDGVEQVLIVSVPGVMSVDLKTGKTLWKHPFKDRNAIPDALPIGDGKVFLTSGYGVGSEVIQVARADDGSFEVRSLGKNEAGSQIHTPLVVGEHIYAVCNAKSRSDGMVCFDQKCDILWKTGRKPNLSRGSQILTGDGLIYALDGRHGNLLIIEPNPKGYKELSRTEPVISGSEIWAPMSLAEGRLIVRDHDKMKCLNVKP